MINMHKKKFVADIGTSKNKSDKVLYQWPVFFIWRAPKSHLGGESWEPGV